MKSNKKIVFSIVFLICGAIFLIFYVSIHHYEQLYGKPGNVSNEYRNLIRPKFRRRFFGVDYNIPARQPVTILTSTFIDEKNEPHFDKILLIHKTSSHNQHVKLMVNSVSDEFFFDKGDYLPFPFNTDTYIAKSVRQAYHQIRLNIAGSSVKKVIDTDSLKYIAANFKQATLFYDDAREPDIVIHSSPDSVLPINIVLLQRSGRVYFIAAMSIYHAVPLSDDFLHQILTLDSLPVYNELHDSDFIQVKHIGNNRKYSIIR